MYLVDTSIISAGAPAKAARSPALIAWMNDNSEDLYLSVISIAEIEAGIAKLRREQATRKAASLAQWLDVMLHLYGSRILPFDTAAARLTGALLDRAIGAGHAPGFADAAIAGTAKLYGYVILTTNVRHFQVLDAAFLNPLRDLPGPGSAKPIDEAPDVPAD
jgi:predicted nucleic acid-binding protein